MEKYINELDKFILENEDMLKKFLESVKNSMVGCHYNVDNKDFNEGFDEALNQYDNHLDTHVESYIKIINNIEER